MSTGHSQLDDISALQDRVRQLEDALDACESEREMLRRNERRYRLLVEQCPGAIVIHSGEQIVFANRAAVALAGARSASELLDHPIWDFVAEDRREHVRNKFHDFEDNDADADFAIEGITTLDGRVIYAEVLAIPIEFDGQPATLAAVKDVTERKNSEREQQRQHADIAHAQRLATVGEMSSEMIHEVNNPLSAISSFSEAGLFALDSPEDQSGKLRDYLTTIKQQSARVGQIMARFRDFARFSKPELTMLSLNDVIQSMMPILDVEAKRFQVAIDLALDESIPQVEAEKLLIEQVLVNLVRNGIESMGAIPLEKRMLAVTTSCDNGEVETSVRDAGVGIPDDEMDLVFDRFFTRKTNGVGLGLAISKTVVENHNGRIWVTRNDGPGVTFHFTLPAKRK